MSLASTISGRFKWRQFEPEVILLAIGWYLRFSLSHRDVEELLAERGVAVDHVTLWRWVQRYAPELEKRLRKRLKATNASWRVDETYVRVKGQWRYLYRGVDSSGATLDFLLSAQQDAEAARRFLAKALGRQNHPEPRVIHTDGHGAYPPAIEQLKEEGALAETCRHRVGRYLNNLVEQDHRAIKRRVKASQHFRSFWAARRTLAGYEAIHMLRKGQALGSSSDGSAVPLHAFIASMFGFQASNILSSHTPFLLAESCNTTKATGPAPGFQAGAPLPFLSPRACPPRESGKNRGLGCLQLGR